MPETVYKALEELILVASEFQGQHREGGREGACEPQPTFLNQLLTSLAGQHREIPREGVFDGWVQFPGERLLTLTGRWCAKAISRPRGLYTFVDTARLRDLLMMVRT